MLHAAPRAATRRGLSLLEVLAALAIFLLSLIGLGQLVIMGGERARDVEGVARATQLAQSKLAEVAAGALPLSSESGVAFDEDPNWTWSLEASQSEIPNLWDVSIQVNRKTAEGNPVGCTLHQMVLDPSARGSAYDAELTAQQNAANNSSSSSSSTSSSSTSSSPNASGAGASAAANKGRGGNTVTRGSNNNRPGSPTTRGRPGTRGATRPPTRGATLGPNQGNNSPRPSPGQTPSGGTAGR
jgi:general secretion pathway protein I